MKVVVNEIIKNNYVIDATGVGVKQFEFNPNNLGDIIEEDLTSNYECITYFNSLIKSEDEIYTTSSTSMNTQLDIRVFFKASNCRDKDNMLGIIESYLSSAFIK